MLKVAYDGTDFHGWQKAENVRTVAGDIDKAIQELTGETIECSGASRTDAGVHAYGNLCVFDTDSTIPDRKYRDALNTHLQRDVRIIESTEVAADFHPRFAKTEKTYRYRILNSKDPDPMRRLYTCHVTFPLDEELMDRAAGLLLGEHDFKSFCSVHTEAKTTVREITGIEVMRESDEVVLTVKGYGFLYNMVRIIAGTLIEVGRGRYSVSDVKEMLEACDRTRTGPTAPPEGLALMKIDILE